MTAPWPQFERLPVDGRLWLLTWLGPFFIDQNMPSQHSILAAVNPVHKSPNLTLPQLLRHGSLLDQLGHPKVVSFGVGDLPSLTTFTLFRDRRPINRNDQLLTFFDADVDFDQQQVFRLADAASDTSLPQPDTLMDPMPILFSPSACVSVAHGGDPHGVIVPVPELLRWCYGSSSRMLQAVLSGEVQTALNEFYARSRWSRFAAEASVPDGFVEQDAATFTWPRA